MATKPSIGVFVWATDVNYSTGPAALIGTATKVAAPAAKVDEGWNAREPPPAQWQNDLVNKITQWTDWVRQGSFDNSNHPHILESTPNGTFEIVDTHYTPTPEPPNPNPDDASQVSLSVLAAAKHGDGSDGDVTLGAGPTVLARDMFYNDITVPVGATLEASGFRIYARGLCDIQVGGVINGGLEGSIGVKGAGAIGANNGVDGFPGGDVDGRAGTPSGTGGPGGTGDAGANLGGTGGVGSEPAADIGKFRALDSIIPGFVTGLGGTEFLSGGAGGGSGGAGPGASLSGAGGQGGGVAFISARIVNNEGAINCNGQNGFAAVGGSDGGGGGGGGGGQIFIVAQKYMGAGALNVTAGIGGPGDGTGVVGAAGGLGSVITHFT